MSATAGRQRQAALEKDLHDLCQPLTLLQCRLELGRMAGDEVSLREAVEGGLAECGRVLALISCMRQRLMELDQKCEESE